MGRYSGKTCRLLAMISITFAYFIVEITIGFTTRSLALVGDSYHMLSDVVALFIGLASVRISRWDSQKNTYGWARAEVLGALTNSVFLVALCFTIFVEALERLVNPEKIKDPNLLLIVGVIGLCVNIVGLFLFSGHAHGHSHGGHGHSHSKKDNAVPDEQANGAVNSKKDDDHEPDCENDNVSVEIIAPRSGSSSGQLNMKGVFLHVLGDALGSVVVVISALILKFVDDEQTWKYRVDPAMSLVMICIIVTTTIPLFKESSMILLQTVPNHIQPIDLEEKLLSNIDGISGVHEFHVWRLAGNRVIATAHIHCHDLQEYMQVAKQVKVFFHNEGIHSTTIQPEFIGVDDVDDKRPCILECGPDKHCHEDTCCANRANGTLPQSLTHRQKSRRTSEGSPTFLKQRSEPAPESEAMIVLEVHPENTVSEGSA